MDTSKENKEASIRIRVSKYWIHSGYRYVSLL